MDENSLDFMDQAFDNRRGFNQIIIQLSHIWRNAGSYRSFVGAPFCCYFASALKVKNKSE